MYWRSDVGNEGLKRYDGSAGDGTAACMLAWE